MYWCNAGFSARDLRNESETVYTANNLGHAGFTAADLTDAGLSLRDLGSAG